MTALMRSLQTGTRKNTRPLSTPQEHACVGFARQRSSYSTEAAHNLLQNHQAYGVAQQIWYFRHDTTSSGALQTPVRQKPKRYRACRIVLFRLATSHASSVSPAPRPVVSSIAVICSQDSEPKTKKHSPRRVA